MEDIRKRGMSAASAYIERIGLPVLASSRVALITQDGDTLVHVEVVTADSSEEMERLEGLSRPIAERALELGVYMDGEGLEAMQLRFDEIKIRVIEEDRALLRHHRNIAGEVTEDV